MWVLVLILIALLAAAAVVAYLYWLNHPELREQFAQRWQTPAKGRQQQQELRDQFRHALAHALRDTPLAQFDFDGFVRQTGVPHDLAVEEAERMYTRLYARALEDRVITASERRQLVSLGKALALRQATIEAIEKKANEQTYRQTLAEALEDGVITQEELMELEDVRRSLGMTEDDVRDASGEGGAMVYLAKFREIAQKGPLAKEDVAQLAKFRRATGLDEAEAHSVIRQDALDLYREEFCDAKQDGHISPEEERELANLQVFLGLSQEDVGIYKEEVRRLKFLEACRHGELPSVRTKAILEGGEICHGETKCNYQWSTPTAVKSAEGEVIFTSKRTIFSSDVKHFQFRPANVIDIELYSNAVAVQTTAGQGSGTYFVADPQWFEAILFGLVSRHKYLLADDFSSSYSRHIPDDVKRLVWSRDGGRCVKCSATDYLEYDHIIPHSKGGANSFNNVQLLCRRCNQVKSDRI